MEKLILCTFLAFNLGSKPLMAVTRVEEFDQIMHAGVTRQEVRKIMKAAREVRVFMRTPVRTHARGFVAKFVAAGAALALSAYVAADGFVELYGLYHGTHGVPDKTKMYVALAKAGIGSATIAALIYKLYDATNF